MERAQEYVPRVGRLSARGLWTYVLIGLAFCLLAQVLFWFQLGGEGLLLIPFLWAYSQESMLELITHTDNANVQIAAWILSYLVLGVVLWLCLDGSAKFTRHALWKRALAHGRRKIILSLPKEQKNMSGV